MGMNNTPGYFVNSTPRGGYSGYDHAVTLAAVKQALSRTRTRKYFILEDDSPDLSKLTCSCGKPLNADDGNRCTYYKGTVKGQHYTCSWMSTMKAVLAIRI